jgi:hypothetical protein
MPITTMCKADDQGAVFSDYWSNRDSSNPKRYPVYLQTSHVGLVLSKGENNGYHDSDFWALVWNDEQGKPERIEYASTRGWSYPNTATVDATPEVLAKYKAYLAEQQRQGQVERERCAAATPTKGKRVRVVKGRKVPVGTIGTVFWYGQAREFGFAPRNGYKAHARDMHAYAESLCPPSEGLKRGRRVGLLLDNGDKVFTDATNVDVINE